jgi:peptide/nickel transport system substrate-binding protein
MQQTISKISEGTGDSTERRSAFRPPMKGTSMAERPSLLIGRLRSARARRLLAPAVAALAVAALAAGCGSSSSGESGGGGPPSDTFTLANAVNVDTLDPAANSVNESIWLTQNIYERLVQPNADGTKIIPQLATSWDISQDGLTYTFHLRKAKFQDGSPVTASDAVFSIKRSINYEGGWGFLLESVKDVTAPDPRTVVVTLKQPHAPLLADLAMYAYAVVPQKLVQAQGQAFFQHPIGSNEWKLVSWKKGSQLTFRYNKFWWGPKPKFTTFKVMIVPNDNSRVLLLQNKNADVIENPPGNLVDQLDKQPDLQAQLFPSTRVEFIQLDHHYAPFADPNVRKAINYAIDRKAVIKLAYSDHAVEGSSFMPYKMLYWNSSLKPYPYDLDKAKQYMAKSKFPNGFDTFLIEVANDVAGNATAVVLKSQLAKIGIKVDIRTYELLTAYEKEDNGHSQMGQRYWTNDIIDPDEVTTFGVDPNGGANAFSSYWGNPTATKLVHDARAELDPKKRQQMYEQIQKIVYDESPYIVLDYSPYRYASGKWVNGFHASPLGAYNLSLQTLTVSTP